MNAATLDDLRPRKTGGISRAALLALIAHGLLVVALSLGVSWHRADPPGVEAELWAAIPQAAAPRAVEPEPVPPKPTPQPAPQPKAETPPPPPVNRDADIAREKREQKDKLEKQRQEDERKEDAARKKAQEQAKADAEKRDADRQKKQAAERDAQLAKQREENLKRITGQAGATGAPDSAGTAAQSAGPSASYAGRIKARIKPNVVFADEIAGNPLASVEIKVAPDGTIVGSRLVKSSGVAAWDEAVLRAIDKTEILPRDIDGRVPPAMLLDFRPRDF